MLQYYVKVKMYNWNIDLNKLNKDPKAAALWKIEQAVNFGLNGTKIDKNQLKKHWKKLHIDPARKRFLKFLLWPSKP